VPPRRLLGLFAIALVACAKSEAPAKAARIELEAGGMKWQVFDGTWRLEGDGLVGSGSRVLSKTEVADGTFELDVEEVSPGQGNTVGIGFRYSLTYDDLRRASGYSFNKKDQTFTVVRGANNYFQPVNGDLRGFSPSGLFQAAKNHIAIHVSGKTFRIEVNGDTLISFDDSSVAHGHLSLWVSSPEPVRFSNLRITRQ
jgi:hypothetical protein